MYKEFMILSITDESELIVLLTAHERLESRDSPGLLAAS